MVWKRIMAVILVIALVSSSGVARYYHSTGGASQKPAVESLELLGYNYARGLAQLSITLWNRGSDSVSIMDIFYDGGKLAKGVIGSSPKIQTNNIIFAASDHWNLDNGGGGEPTIRPNTIAILYLGVSSLQSPSLHTLLIVASSETYAFNLEFRNE